MEEKKREKKAGKLSSKNLKKCRYEFGDKAGEKQKSCKEDEIRFNKRKNIKQMIKGKRRKRKKKLEKK